MANQASWRNRIVGYGEESPEQLAANPKNWRIHPQPQADALAGVLSDVGVVQNIIVNRQTGYVVDGHLRVSLALRTGQPTIPVTYVDLSPEEEALILATLDPIGALAATDKEQLDALLRDVSTGDAAVMALLSDLAQQAGVIPPDAFDPNAEWQGMPEFSQEDQTAAFQVTVNFARMEDVAAFEALVGQHVPRNTRSIWYPPVERGKFRDQAYIEDADAA